MPLPRVSSIPEAFLDTIVINGGVYPKVSVLPKRVRFRLLNGSQARFYHLNLYPEHRSNSGEARVGTPGPVIYQVGTEGGFLPRWRSTTTASQFRSIRLILRKLPQWRMGRQPAAGACRASRRRHRLQRCACGKQLHSVQRRAGTVPGGDSRNDYFTGCPDQTEFGGAPPTKLGRGANTRTLMKITVTAERVIASRLRPGCRR